MTRLMACLGNGGPLLHQKKKFLLDGWLSGQL